MTILTTLSMLVLLVPLSGASTVTFEELSDGTILTSQYPGLTFTNATVLTAGISLNEFDFPPYSGANVIFDDGGPISVVFDAPVLGVSGFATYLVSVTLTAFDANGNVLASLTSAYGNNSALSGDTGSSPNELMQLSASVGIKRVTITGDQLGGSFVVDDFTTSNVPEPGSLALVLAGMVALSLRECHKRRRPLCHVLKRRGRVIVLSVFWLGGAVQAAPTLGATMVAPELINTGAPSQITVSSVITDPALITTSVNLVRIHPTGSVRVIGQLRDDGTNGDTIAGDKTYTAVVSLSEPGETTIRLQVSAAFRGILQRSTSQVLSVYVTLPGLPPDPGEAGLATLEGIDYDKNGIRDDLQRFIELTYPSAPSTRNALLQQTRVLQQIVLVTGPAPSLVQSYNNALDCLAYIRPNDETLVRRQLLLAFLNTAARASAYMVFNRNAGGIYSLRPQPNFGCSFPAPSKEN
jgi:hypothetical protein